MDKQDSSNSSESDERYQAFLGNSQEGIWRIELEQPISIKLPPKKQIKLMYQYGYLAECNDAMARMYGFKNAKQLLGIRLSDLLIESDPANTAYLAALIENNYKLSGVESHEKDREGNDKYFRNSLIGIIEDGYITRAWGTQQDITDQHQAIADKLKSEAHLKFALSASKLGTWEWNVQTNELTWSDELKVLFGMKTKDTITFEKYQTLIHPADRKKMLKVIQGALKTGEPYSMEHRVLYPNGDVHWLLGQGQASLKDDKVEYMIGTAMNIDEQKNFEFKLTESELRFRTMADTAPVLIWMAGPDMLISYLNKPWQEYTGRKLKQDLGNGWREIIHPDDLERCVKTYEACFKRRQSFSIEYRMRRWDGVYRLVVDRGSPRFSSKDEFLGYIGSCNDIEDIKRAVQRSTELEMKNQQLELRRQELVALNTAKDEFISIASHQLRTPATGVKQYVGMLLEGFAGALTEEQRAMLTAAYQSNERQINIVNDLLKVAQIDSGKIKIQKRKTDIRKLIEDIIGEQRPSFTQRNQLLLVNKSRGEQFCRIDERLIRMVVENLIDNAGKYSPVGANVKVIVNHNKNRLIIKVRDMGIGISKQDQTRLFQKFSRLENSHTSSVEGTGLGLYWSKTAVELHGGKIKIDSKPGKGSAFIIDIPCK